MMTDKIKAAVVLMTQIALVMFLYAFWVTPWYEVSMTGDTSPYEDASHNAGEYQYFAFDYVWTSGTGVSWTTEYDGGDPFYDIMKIEGILLGVVVLFLFAYVTIVLVGRELDLMVASVVLVAMCCVAVGYFVLMADEAIKETFWSLDSVPVDGFYGTGTDLSGRYWSWGPAGGFYLSCAASLLQGIAVMTAYFSRPSE